MISRPFIRRSSSITSGGMILRTAPSLPAHSQISFCSKHFSIICSESSGLIFPKSIPQINPMPRSSSLSSREITSLVMKSLTISPLRRVSASTLFSSSQSNEALPAMNESWLPRNVPLCSAGFHWSSSSLSKTTRRMCLYGSSLPGYRPRS